MVLLGDTELRARRNLPTVLSTSCSARGGVTRWWEPSTHTHQFSSTRLVASAFVQLGCARCPTGLKESTQSGSACGCCVRRTTRTACAGSVAGRRTQHESASAVCPGVSSAPLTGVGTWVGEACAASWLYCSSSPHTASDTTERPTRVHRTAACGHGGGACEHATARATEAPTRGPSSAAGQGQPACAAGVPEAGGGERRSAQHVRALAENHPGAPSCLLFALPLLAR